jgi:hypothetical protein
MVTSLSQQRERIEVDGPADTLQMFFDSDFVRTIAGGEERGLSRGLEPVLRASAIQALVGLSRPGTDVQLESAIN